MSGTVQGMTTDTVAVTVGLAEHSDLSPAVNGYLARYKGLSRRHTGSDLRVFLTWCTAAGLDPLRAWRHELELNAR